MALDAGTLVEEMHRSVPSFSPDPEYVEDGLTYFLINDLGRFICRSAHDGSWDAVKEAVGFLDSFLASEEPEVEKLVRDCIWGLLDCPDFDKVKPLFGARLRTLSARYPPS